MKTSLFLALAFATGTFAGTYEAPKLKIPDSPDSSKIESKTADWQEMNDTKLSHDEVPVRQLASDPEPEVAIDPKDRGPSSDQVPNPSVEADKNYQEKVKFWKYERERPHSKQ
ncbi:MAG: hypothetical protein A2X86_06610 [Bdellovibrionales bacterium GWA2_49_15]|nr:MAG: hypothetical protein A2X86_06610 [Bdellovibrionales bacterium GWA2_49_15]HAZ12056.1 hypothetical protein [Bdellovibrionales bacterium]